MKSLTPVDKPLHWVGSSKKDLLGFPELVMGDFGYALGLIQLGGMPPSAKPWKGEGPGVFELGEDNRAYSTPTWTPIPRGPGQ